MQAWRAWQDFVLLQKAGKEMAGQAVTAWVQHRLRSAFTRWQQYTAGTKELQQMGRLIAGRLLHSTQVRWVPSL